MCGKRRKVTRARRKTRKVGVEMDGEVFQSEKGGKKKEGTRLRDGREKSRGREGEKTAAMAVQNCGLFMDFGGQKPFADLPPFVILAGLDTKGTVWSKEAFFFLKKSLH